MDRRRKRLLLYGLMTAAVMVMIFCFSGQNGEESSGLSDWLRQTGFGQALLRVLPAWSDEEGYTIRKYAHMAEYALLAVPSLLFFRELLRRKRPALYAFLGLLLCFLYACSDEWHQLFVPERNGTFTDVMIDTGGAAIAVILTLLILRLKLRLRKERE